MKFFQHNRTLYLSILVTIVYAIVYGSISLWNHYVFRTFAYDLGIKNQALWDYAHLRMNYNTILQELNGEINILANHFEPVIMLFAPLYYVFGSYTLLVVQIFFLLLGGWGIRRLIIHQSGNEWLALIGMLTFYSMWGVFGALSFDFHTNVIAASVVPWFFAFSFEKRWVNSGLILLFIILCKENMALWAIFLSLGMVFYFLNKDKKGIIVFLLFFFISTVAFVLIMKVIIPYYADRKIQYLHFSYSVLGKSMSEAIATLITKPLYWIPLLWKSPYSSPDPFVTDSKIWLHQAVFLSGGIFLIFRPYFLIMLIPIYFQKLFADGPARWSIFLHYNIEFVPVLTACAFVFLSSINSWRLQFLSGFLLLISVADVSKDLMDRWNPSPYKNENIKFYSVYHYTREINYRAYHKVLSYYIPPNASVSANSFLVPHLAFRKKIYQFPIVNDADYLAVCDDYRNYYPFESGERSKFLFTRDSIAQNKFAIVFDDNILKIYKRIDEISN